MDRDAIREIARSVYAEECLGTFLVFFLSYIAGLVLTMLAVWSQMDNMLQTLIKIIREPPTTTNYGEVACFFWLIFFLYKLMKRVNKRRTHTQ